MRREASDPKSVELSDMKRPTAQAAQAPQEEDVGDDFIVIDSSEGTGRVRGASADTHSGSEEASDEEAILASKKVQYINFSTLSDAQKYSVTADIFHVIKNNSGAQRELALEYLPSLFAAFAEFSPLSTGEGRVTTFIKSFRTKTNFSNLQEQVFDLLTTMLKNKDYAVCDALVKIISDEKTSEKLQEQGARAFIAVAESGSIETAVHQNLSKIAGHLKTKALQQEVLNGIMQQMLIIPPKTVKLSYSKNKNPNQLSAGSLGVAIRTIPDADLKQEFLMKLNVQFDKLLKTPVPLLTHTAIAIIEALNDGADHKDELKVMIDKVLQEYVGSYNFNHTFILGVALSQYGEIDDYKRNAIDRMLASVSNPDTFFDTMKALIHIISHIDSDPLVEQVVETLLENLNKNQASYSILEHDVAHKECMECVAELIKKTKKTESLWALANFVLTDPAENIDAEQMFEKSMPVLENLHLIYECTQDTSLKAEIRKRVCGKVNQQMAIVENPFGANLFIARINTLHAFFMNENEGRKIEFADFLINLLNKLPATAQSHVKGFLTTILGTVLSEITDEDELITYLQKITAFDNKRLVLPIALREENGKKIDTPSYLEKILQVMKKGDKDVSLCAYQVFSEVIKNETTKQEDLNKVAANHPEQASSNVFTEESHYQAACRNLASEITNRRVAQMQEKVVGVSRFMRM